MRLRCLVILMLFAVPFTGFTQSRYSQLKELYTFVDQTDSLADKSTKNFYLEKFLRDGFNYRETWRYMTKGDRIVYFQVDYMLDSTEFSEVYYVNRGHLVCTEEYEKMNYTLREDELKFGGIYFFESSVPRHIVMLGRRDYSNGYSDPASLALSRFSRRFSELKRHMPMLPDAK